MSNLCTKPVTSMTPTLFARRAQPPSFAELNNLKDNELMAQLRAGCGHALAVLFDRYHRLINQTTIDEAETLSPEPPSTLRKFAHHELRHLLGQGLATLTRPQRLVLALASYNGLSMKDIAKKTGNSVSNVRHHYYRGLLKLRSFISATPETSRAVRNHN